MIFFCVKNDNVSMRIFWKFSLNRFQLHFLHRYVYFFFFIKNLPNILGQTLAHLGSNSRILSPLWTRFFFNCPVDTYTLSLSPSKRRLLQTGYVVFLIFSFIERLNDKNLGDCGVVFIFHMDRKLRKYTDLKSSCTYTIHNLAGCSVHRPGVGI